MNQRLFAGLCAVIAFNIWAQFDSESLIPSLVNKSSVIIKIKEVESIEYSYREPNRDVLKTKQLQNVTFELIWPKQKVLPTVLTIDMPYKTIFKKHEKEMDALTTQKLAGKILFLHRQTVPLSATYWESLPLAYNIFVLGDSPDPHLERPLRDYLDENGLDKKNWIEKYPGLKYGQYLQSSIYQLRTLLSRDTENWDWVAHDLKTKKELSVDTVKDLIGLVMANYPKEEAIKLLKEVAETEDHENNVFHIRDEIAQLFVRLEQKQILESWVKNHEQLGEAGETLALSAKILWKRKYHLALIPSVWQEDKKAKVIQFLQGEKVELEDGVKLNYARLDNMLREHTMDPKILTLIDSQLYKWANDDNKYYQFSLMFNFMADAKIDNFFYSTIKDVLKVAQSERIRRFLLQKLAYAYDAPKAPKAQAIEAMEWVIKNTEGKNENEKRLRQTMNAHIRSHNKDKK